jgi:hypothetical protein
MQRLPRFRKGQYKRRMPTWIIGVVLNDLARSIGIGLLDIVDRNLVGIAFFFRVQRETISACCHERAQTFQHAATVLKPSKKCNQTLPLQYDGYSRGHSEAARCASTEDHQAPSPPLFREQEDDQAARFPQPGFLSQFMDR